MSIGIPICPVSATCSSTTRRPTPSLPVRNPLRYASAVATGTHVQVGQSPTEGSKAPADIMRIQGLDEVYAYLIKEVRKVYRSQSCNVNDKHIEIIARQMTRKIRIGSRAIRRFCPVPSWTATSWRRSIPGRSRKARHRAGAEACLRYADPAGYHQGSPAERVLPVRRLLPGRRPRCWLMPPSAARSITCAD